MITDSHGATIIPGLVLLPCGCQGHGAVPDFICAEHADYITANTKDFTRLVWIRLREDYARARRERFEVITNGTPEWRKAMFDMESE